MSKASDFATKGAQPTFQDGIHEARVTVYGQMEIDDHRVWSPQEALALARWILDTFGEDSR